MNDVYILADCVRYLQVPADVHVVRMDAKDEGEVRIRPWSTEKLSVEDVFKQKDVPWQVMESTDIDTTEFRRSEEGIVTDLQLVSSRGYSEENGGCERKFYIFLTTPVPSREKQVCKPREFFSLKLQVQVLMMELCWSLFTVIMQHEYVDDNICKHALAVATFKLILAAHLDFIKKKSRKDRNRTALAEHDVRKTTTTKKGGKNKYVYRPARGMAQPNSSETSMQHPIVLGDLPQ